MTIETIYSIGEKVWVMRGGRPDLLTVKQVAVTVDYWWNTLSRNKQNESYFLANGTTAFCHHEWYSYKKIFPSKEALLQSL